ncbi:hypothetical protein K8Q94_03635 [Candidatus Nomurabacteria bacterium]|nr:hypothetical protein [Candidatus Nomurabacteria bacterium]
MEKQTKNWWVFEYSELATRSGYINPLLDEKGGKIFYGTLDEALVFIADPRTGLKIFNFYFKNEKINYFHCEKGKLILCLLAYESPCDFIKKESNLNARCLKHDGTFDLTKEELLIKKFDEYAYFRRNG